MSHKITRRHFLKQSGAMGAAASLGMPLVMNLTAPTGAHAAVDGGYKALVCVFLAGGNEAHNTVFRTDRGLDRFRAARPSVSADVLEVNGLPRNPLQMQPGWNRTGIDGMALALHPSLANVKTLFESGRLAIVGDVGPLIEPTTASAVVAGTARMPPKLSSHNDQTSIWQSGRSEGATVGWGGEMVRRFAELNQVDGQVSQLFSAVAVESTPVFCAGSHPGMPDNKPPVSMFGAAKGVGTLRPGGLRASEQNGETRFLIYEDQRLRREDVLADVFSGLIGVSELPDGVAGLIEQDYLTKLKGAQRAWETAEQALTKVTMTQTVPAGNHLAAQLAVVARMVKSSGSEPLSLKRQVFYVQLGGFDTHSGQIGAVNSHSSLLRQLDVALKYFDDEQGQDRDKVMTFTASELGRKLNENGDGTDHGWGGHHFVMGGAQTRGVYGYFPDLDSWDDNRSAYRDEHLLPDGTLVPKVPVDLYAKEFGAWLGIDWRQGSNREVARLLFPNLSENEPLLGFTQATA